MRAARYERKGAKWSDCGSKRRYRDEKEANAVRKYRMAESGVPLRTYDCPFCKGVHLSSKEVASV